MTFTVNLSSINSCKLNDISSQCQLNKLFIHCIFEYWMLLYSFSFLWIASDEYMFLKRWIAQMASLCLKYLAGNTKKSLDCNGWCRDRYSNVCLNWGRHFYLRSSIEEDHYYGPLWVDYSGHGAMTQCCLIAGRWVIIDNVDPQLKQRLVFAGCSTERYKKQVLEKIYLSTGTCKYKYRCTWPQPWYRPVIFQFVFRKRCFLKFWGNVLVSIGMLIMTVMGFIYMSRQFFNTFVGMVSRSHDFDDDLKISFLISSSDALSKTIILDLISVFCTGGIFCTFSGNLERIFLVLSTQYLEKWSQSDFTDVNSGRAGGGILCRMLLIQFHRRWGLSEFSEITSA